MVEIKKLKITKQIFSQLRRPFLENITALNILGIVYLPKELPYIILYNEESKTPYKYPLFKEVSNNDNTLVVKLGGNYIDACYSLKDLNEVNIAKENLNQMKEIAKEKGQIFI